MKNFNFFCRYSAFAVCAFILISLFALPMGAQSGGIPCKSSDRANAVYFYELNSEKLLFQKNADLPIAPASTVKLMTALVVFENIPDLSQTVTVSDAAVSYTKMNVMSLKAGERISAADLLSAMLCSGYNDATVALAIHACGSIDAFVEKMNEKALSIGTQNTLYKDPTGLDDSARTTASDTFLVAKEFFNNKYLLETSSKSTVSIPATNMSEKKTLYNRNALISAHTGTKYLNAYAVGMNAGMTDIGGYCLVTNASKSDTDYICVVMGAQYDTENETVYSYVIANELINYVTKTLGKRDVVSKNEVITTMNVSGASINNNTVNIVPKDAVTASLPVNYEDDEKFNITYVYIKEELKAPVKKGEKVGMIVISYSNEIVSIHDLVTAEDVERDTFISVLDAIRAFLFGKFLIASLLCFTVIFVTYMYVIPIITKRKKRRRYNYMRFE